MRVIRGRDEGQPTARGSDEWFTGDVWLDRIIPAGGHEAIHCSTVTFEPGARTRWHTHEGDQILIVLSGEGRVSDTARGTTIRAGDVVHIPAGEKHWHGAAPGTIMSHLAVTAGEAQWMEAVSEEEYGAF